MNELNELRYLYSVGVFLFETNKLCIKTKQFVEQKIIYYIALLNFNML